MSDISSPQKSSQEAKDPTVAQPEASWPTPYVIAIDGPAGAGKSSVSSRLAGELTFFRLDTGVLYRGIALEATRAAIGPVEDESLQRFLVTRRSRCS